MRRRLGRDIAPHQTRPHRPQADGQLAGSVGNSRYRPGADVAERPVWAARDDWARITQGPPFSTASFAHHARRFSPHAEVHRPSDGSYWVAVLGLPLGCYCVLRLCEYAGVLGRVERAARAPLAGAPAGSTSGAATTSSCIPTARPIDMRVCAGIQFARNRHLDHPRRLRAAAREAQPCTSGFPGSCQRPAERGLATRRR